MTNYQMNLKELNRIKTRNVSKIFEIFSKKGFQIRFVGGVVR